MLAESFARLLDALTEAAHACYGPRLVSLAVYGSVARGTAHADSDVDLLLVADDLPPGRVKRVTEFDAVEQALGPALAALAREGIVTRLSPVIKTRAETEAGSPLFLDMTEDARILYDREGFLASYLESFRRRLEALGAKRVWRGSTWYWDLKPDYAKGDTFTI